MYAVAIAFESLALKGQHCRVDVHVDGQVTIHAWNGQDTRSREFTLVAKRILDFVTRRNLALTMSYVPSRLNTVDLCLLNLSKSGAMFSSSCWDLVQSEFGNVGFIIWILRN